MGFRLNVSARAHTGYEAVAGYIDSKFGSKSAAEFARAVERALEAICLDPFGHTSTPYRGIRIYRRLVRRKSWIYFIVVGDERVLAIRDARMLPLMPQELVPED